VLQAEDIISELAPVLKGFIRAAAKSEIVLSEAERGLCDCLTREPMHIDAVSREAGLPVYRILDILLSLELKGVVRQSDGKRFYLA
jgi:DNA processing protein